MLKAVVQQVQSRTEGCFGHFAGLAPVFANDHVNAQLARDEQRLVAKVGC